MPALTPTALRRAFPVLQQSAPLSDADLAGVITAAQQLHRFAGTAQNYAAAHLWALHAAVGADGAAVIDNGAQLVKAEGVGGVSASGVRSGGVNESAV